MIEKIDNSILALDNVLFKNGLLTNDIRNEALSILQGNVPSSWISFWDGPINPLDWLRGFSRKAICIKSWL